VHTFLTLALEVKGSFNLVTRVIGTHWYPELVSIIQRREDSVTLLGIESKFSRCPTLATILIELPQNKNEEEKSLKRDKGCLIFVRSMAFLVRPSWLHTE
jgi:hypothetical protein